MRILLIGEYSRLHNSLKEALLLAGHEVTIVGNGDGFKSFPVDLNIDAKFSKSRIPNVFRQVVYRVFNYDFARIEYGIRFKRILPTLKNYDIVQLISETPIQTSINFEYRLLKQLRAQNKKMVMLCSGTDTIFMQAVADKKFRYSLFDPYLKDNSTVFEYRQALQSLTPKYKNHYRKMLPLISGVIATDIDYKIAIDGKPESLGMIPNPVNIDAISFAPNDSSEKIVIFHGINRWNYNKKGNVFFEKAAEIIKAKYPEKVEVITAENLPYSQYITLYNRAHIVLDQVYAYDQGYNALEAMATGKVVFTGAEPEFENYYGLNERVAINALPDVDAIVDELSALIENPAEIAAIGKRARAFIEKEHDYRKIAAKYLGIWSKS
ncbi:MAG: glycosyltransferase family 1 protein [Flavobacterium sp.]|nr:MAG: glycosyltransferase family 1 protein [Flavobacterium sp.]